MPDEPQPKLCQHPLRQPAPAPAPTPAPASSSSAVAGQQATVVFSHRARRPARPSWGELAVTSNHTFLNGASHPEELVREAARLGHAGIALTDFETFGGAVRAHVAARETVVGEHGGVHAGARPRLAHGARVRFSIDDLPWSKMPDAGARSCEPSAGETIDILLYPSDRASWGAMCRLLTKARTAGAVTSAGAADRTDVEGGAGRAAGGARGAGAQERRHRLHLSDLAETLRTPGLGGESLLGVVLAPRIPSQRFLEAAQGLAALMHDRLAVALTRVDDPDSAADAERSEVLADALGLPLAALSDVRMHALARKPLLDTLACIRDGVSIDRAARQIAQHAERRLRPPSDILRRYADRPDALATAWRFLDRAAAFSLDELRYEYPDEVVPQGMPPMQHLRNLVWKGARERYPRGVPAKVARQFEHEFAIIDDLGYAPYFLTVHDIVAFARSRGILCQGRGAAANSAVCYALGVTAVDPDRIDVLFERFVSRERNEPPDIDIDFEHERREEVIQHIYAKYGRDRAALVCEIISYRGRSAVRDVGKALGFAPDTVDRLASEVDRWSGGGLGSRDDVTEGSFETGLDRTLPQATAERVRAAGLDPSAPRVRAMVQLVGEILGFPRHRSQHVGGFVISRTPLMEIVPIERAAMEDRTILEWDKDDIEALGMLKIDLLSLGMLTAIRKSIDLVNGDSLAIALGGRPERMPDAPQVRPDLAHVSPPQPSVPSSATPEATAGETGRVAERDPLLFHSIPAEDPSTYDMICKADTVGVFQIESRAQMSMLPRLKPRRFYDLVIEVAIVRPGPIQGDMVHPYLRRRSGQEPVHYPNEAIRTVLGKTLGVPLFQEQAMALAVVAAGFTAGQADELRRAIAAWKRSGNKIAQFGAALEAGMVARGYSQDFARQVFEQIKGFSGYGFPESHAASFAHLVYASAWLKRHHPAAFAAALLNSQPMGFYAPAQILRDASDHGVAVRGIDVHCSLWDSSLERGPDPCAALANGDAAGVATVRATVQATVQATVRIDGSGLGPRLSCLDSEAGAPRRWRELHMRGTPEALHGEIPFRRLHSRGRSIVARAAPPHDGAELAQGRRSEPLCPPDNSARCSGAPTHPESMPAQPAIRLGLRMVRGLEPAEAQRVIDAVTRHGYFRRISDLAEVSGLAQATLRRLAAADAFGSMGLDRQQAIWQILALRDRERPLWSFGVAPAEPDVRPLDGSTVAMPSDIEPALPPVAELSSVAQDFEATGVTLKRHPVACIRPTLQKSRAIPCAWLRDEHRTPAGKRVRVAGLVLLRQRPSTAKGIVFMTIEDESGTANLIFRPKVYARVRLAVRSATLVIVSGKIERRDGVVHVLVDGARDLSAQLVSGDAAMPVQSRDYR
ncbi:MAG: OB-fold nucleic acid binding domain-containing protein [bacterium]